MLLRCGDPEGEGGEGGARVGVRRPRSGSPEAEVEGTAGEATATVEEVGRFWKYCSPGSSSSSAPHGYTCGGPITMTAEWNLGPFNSPLRPTQTLVYVVNISDLLQLQLQRPEALWHHSRPGIEDHAEVRLG